MDIDSSGYAVVSYDVPHCKFTKTADGFIVRFNKAKISMHRVMNAASQTKGISESLGGLMALALVGAFRLAQSGSEIEVTREAVVIDKKKMRREDFGKFHVSYTWKGQHLERNVAVLGYSFGSQNFEFGGAWPENQANEVAGALNRHLGKTPSNDDTRTAPEVLRTARPVKF